MSTVALDEADALIANLMGLGELAGAYPQNSSKEQAIANWEARCVERARQAKDRCTCCGVSGHSKLECVFWKG